MVRDFDELPAVLTVRDLRAALGISRAKAYELVNSRGFPAIRLGRAVRIPKEALVDWIQKQQKS